MREKTVHVYVLDIKIILNTRYCLTILLIAFDLIDDKSNNEYIVQEIRNAERSRITPRLIKQGSAFPTDSE